LIVVAVISQWRVALSLSLLVSVRLTMDNFSTFCNRFTVQRVTLMLSKFLHVVFTVLFVFTVMFVAKM